MKPGLSVDYVTHRIHDHLMAEVSVSGQLICILGKNEPSGLIEIRFFEEEKKRVFEKNPELITLLGDFIDLLVSLNKELSTIYK